MARPPEMRPRDDGSRTAGILQWLWQTAETELKKACPIAQRPLVYHAGEGLEGGEFGEVPGGFIHIWLYRKERTPDDQFAPDLLTSPLLDCCILTHEYGHFLSDPTLRLREPYEALKSNRLVQPAEADAILAEETRAWDLGREVLRQRGFEEWTAFETYRNHCLRTYFEALGRSTCHSVS